MKTKLLPLSLLLVCASLQAMEFQTLGYKSTAMGGAGVASASGALAGYYNPALLAHTKTEVDVSFGVGVQLRDNGLGAKASKLSDEGTIDAFDAIKDNTPISGSNTQADRDALNSNNINTMLSMNGDSLQVQPSAYLGVQVDNFSLGIYATTEAVAIGNVDQTHDQLIFENSGSYYTYNSASDTYSPTTQSDYETNSIDYAIENGNTNILTLGVVIAEVPLSYAYNFAIPTGDLSVGGSAKIMQGRSFFKTQRVDNKDDDSDNAQDELITSTSFGLDLGLLYVSSEIEGLRAGMMLKNLNSPSFETFKGFDDVTLDPMARIGVSYLILENLEVAADLDLTENKMIDDVTQSRMFGVGISWQAASWFNLSGGFMKNTSNSDEGLIYTAGFGLGPQAFHFDLAAQMSGQQNSYEGQSVPAYANVMLSLNS